MCLSVSVNQGLSTFRYSIKEIHLPFYHSLGGIEKNCPLPAFSSRTSPRFKKKSAGICLILDSNSDFGLIKTTK